MLLRGLILAFAPALAFAPVGAITVTVSMSSASDGAPDRVVYNLTASAGLDKTLDDVVKAIAVVPASPRAI